MNFSKILKFKHLFFYLIISIAVYTFLATRCFVFYGLVGNPASTCTFLPKNLIVFLIEYPLIYWLVSFLISWPLYVLLFKLMKRFNIHFPVVHFTMNNEIFSRYISNITHTVNISLALFFCIWQLILSLCIYSGGIADAYRTRCFGVPVRFAYDSFYYITFYLIILLTTIFFFLIASEKWADRARNLKYFFLTLNIIFIAFLFFEI